jgi:Putative addiction module component
MTMTELQKSRNVLDSPQGVQKMSSEVPTQEEISKLPTQEKIFDDDHSVPDWQLALIEERLERYRIDETATFEEFVKEFEELTKEFEKEDLTQEEIINDDDVPVPDWHLAILEERIARYETEDKTKWRTWEEVQRELLQEIFEEIKRRNN